MGIGRSMRVTDQPTSLSGKSQPTKKLSSGLTLMNTHVHSIPKHIYEHPPTPIRTHDGRDKADLLQLSMNVAVF